MWFRKLNFMMVYTYSICVFVYMYLYICIDTCMYIIQQNFVKFYLSSQNIYIYLIYIYKGKIHL